MTPVQKYLTFLHFENMRMAHEAIRHTRIRERSDKYLTDKRKRKIFGKVAIYVSKQSIFSWIHLTQRCFKFPIPLGKYLFCAIGHRDGASPPVDKYFCSASDLFKFGNKRKSLRTKSGLEISNS